MQTVGTLTALRLGLPEYFVYSYKKLTVSSDWGAGGLNDTTQDLKRIYNKIKEQGKFIVPTSENKTDDYLFVHRHLIRIYLSAISNGYPGIFTVSLPIFAHAWNLYAAYRWYHYSLDNGVKTEFYTKTYFLEPRLQKDDLTPSDVWGIALDVRNLLSHEQFFQRQPARVVCHRKYIRFITKKTVEKTWLSLTPAKLDHRKGKQLTRLFLLKSPETVDMPEDKFVKHAMKVIEDNRGVSEKGYPVGLFMYGSNYAWLFMNSFIPLTSLATCPSCFFGKSDRWSPVMLHNPIFFRSIFATPTMYAKDTYPTKEQRNLYNRMYKLFVDAPLVKHWKIGVRVKIALAIMQELSGGNYMSTNRLGRKNKGKCSADYGLMRDIGLLLYRDNGGDRELVKRLLFLHTDKSRFLCGRKFYNLENILHENYRE